MPQGNDLLIPIVVCETADMLRSREPVRVGVPFPRGMLTESSGIELVGPSGDSLIHQACVLAHWPDDSIKWALVDFQLSLDPGQEATVCIRRARESEIASERKFVIESDRSEALAVDTGALHLEFGQDNSSLFAIEPREGQTLNASARLRMADHAGISHFGHVRELTVEEDGVVRATVRADGVLNLTGDAEDLLFSARVSVFRESRALLVDVCLRNPNPARHVGGSWDLGDSGSALLSDLSLEVEFDDDPVSVEWYSEHPSEAKMDAVDDLVIYQDSSGGENWNSSNHVDASGNSTVRFRGYQVFRSGIESAGDSGLRAQPGMRPITGTGWIGGTVLDFWQNFPNSIRLEEKSLSFGIFPKECEAGFELQGGEQKRHTIVLELGTTSEELSFSSFQRPVEVVVDAHWVESTRAVRGFVAEPSDKIDAFQSYVDSIVSGPTSFFAKREIIDEYGWRHYGDIYADHEAVHGSGPLPLVSHFNNQYDFIIAAHLRFLRTGDQRWQKLMNEGARHTIDIDIYHTERDRPAYSGGLFWHTDHGMDAATCTHRSYSKRNADQADYGGGPSNEHNYTTGLLNYYFSSGDPNARKAVVDLANWVLAMDKGTSGFLSFLYNKPTGLASNSVDPDYHKPGRGAANSINALLDAFALSKEKTYMDKADELVRRCIHPSDNIDALGLEDPEYRWSYLVFLQVLGKYLDVKHEAREHSYEFYYARDSLLHYAKWMLANEVPYKEQLHKVKLPTETWPAQDVRKCQIFHLAANCSVGSARTEFAERAEFFFTRCIEDLLSYETAHFARPRVIVSVFGPWHEYYLTKGYERPGSAFSESHDFDFGEPEHFSGRLARLRESVSARYGVIRSEIQGILKYPFRTLRRRRTSRPESDG